MKWIVVCIFPETGNKYAAAEHKGSFALAPIDHHGRFQGPVFAFDSREQAQTWVDEMRSLSEKGDEFFEKLPWEIEQCMEAQ